MIIRKTGSNAGMGRLANPGFSSTIVVLSGGETLVSVTTVRFEAMFQTLDVHRLHSEIRSLPKMIRRRTAEAPIRRKQRRFLTGFPFSVLQHRFSATRMLVPSWSTREPCQNFNVFETPRNLNYAYDNDEGVRYSEEAP
jgi:hypothetical protein